MSDARDDRTRPALIQLLATLKSRGYQFTTVTPATHARVLARPDRRTASDLRDVFGWSLPFGRELLDAELFDLLDGAGVLERDGASWRSRLRVSTLRGDLYLHSAFPTLAEDAVFFGPDSYRFADLLTGELDRVPLQRGARVLDIGGGAGVGAVVAAHRCTGCEVMMTDINPAALRLAAINTQAAGVTVRLVEGAGLADLEGEFDLVTINPPYIMDEAGRAYRDGGDMHGAALSLELAEQAAGRLAPGGRALLYTGSAIVAGHDPLHEALARRADALGRSLSYRELDPDVFGEELDEPAYADVERIALVAAVIGRAADPLRREPSLP